MINDIPKSLIDAVVRVLTGQTINESTEHPMIEVDGAMKHRLNSMGQPIHHTDEGIRNFHRWFGNSTTVDEHGRPKVMYHGTGAILTRRGTEGGIREFKTKNGVPHWVTDNPNLAHMYSGSASTSNILPVYIKSVSPYKSGVKSDDDWMFEKKDVKKRVLQQSPLEDKSKLSDHVDDLVAATGGHDNRYQALWNAPGSAARFKNMGFDSIHHFERGSNTYAVMDANQIKSAISNSGRFKHNSNQIDESVNEHPMIDVDGQMKHRHNSLGQPIHHTDEGIKNFHRWFGDSKAVDEHGRPLVVYHGSNAHAYSGGSIERFHTNTERGAAFFSSHPEIARQYGEKLYSTYVRLNNPLIIDGDNRSWSDLNPNLKISGTITPELRVADQKKTKDLNNIFSQLGDLFGDDDSSSQTKPKFEGHTNLKHVLSDITDKTTTDDVAKHAKKLGYDGVIFRNIKDSPVHDVKMYKPTSSHIYAVFKPSGVKSTQNSGKFHPDSIITESEEYHEEHSSPDPDTGSPAHDLTKNAYAEDFYSNKGHQYYGDGRDDDKIVHAQLKSLRNRPEAEVKIYRAVPNKDEIKDINPGDWVAITHNYAKDHGELRFGDDHKILTKTVKAKELFTSGDSYHEFGYHPSKQQHYTMSDSVRKAYMNMQND